MSATEPLYSLIKIPTLDLSKNELCLLEAELFLCVCKELKEFFRKQHENYFRVMKYSEEKEDVMLELNFIRLIIKDILSTEEYTVEGIAQYADTHRDVIEEVLIGRNTCPSAKLLHRIIDLHRSIRRDIYNSIIKKIANVYLMTRCVS